jgi:hypothetical protein
MLRVSQISAGQHGANDSMQTVARRHKDALDDDLNMAKINALDELDIFLLNYILDAEDPDIIVQYTNMMRDQWTRQLVRKRAQRTQGLPSETGSPAKSPQARQCPRQVQEHPESDDKAKDAQN